MKMSGSVLTVALLALATSLIVSGGVLKGVVPAFPLDGCDSSKGWLKLQEFCYKLVYSADGQPENIFDISTECQSQGPRVGATGIAYIADIQSQAENDFVAEVVAPNETRAWIGAVRLGANFRWEVSWSEGSQSDLNYTNWKPTEPNNKDSQENCVEINRGGPGRWNDLLCMRKRPAICKYSIVQWNSNQ